jgi:curved DNA-binding protein CbpA
MDEPDLYEILQVPSTAGPEEIRRAYRGLLRKHHPDMHKPRDAVEARRLARNVAAIHHAYEVLSDPGRRAAYDRRYRGAHARPETSGSRAGTGQRGQDIHVRVHRSGDVRGPSERYEPSGPSERYERSEPSEPSPEARPVPHETDPMESDEVRVVRDGPRQNQDEVWISPPWLRPRQDDAVSLFPNESPLRPPPDVFERLLWRWFFR